MSIAAIAWAKTQRTGSPTMKAVLMAVADYADEKGRAWPSQVRLAEDTELSERAVRNALSELVERGFVSRQSRHRPDGSRSSDIITLKLPSEGNRHDVPGVGQQVPGVGHVVPGGGAPRAGHELPLNHQRTESSNELSLFAPAWPRDGFGRFYALYPRKQKPANAKRAWVKVEKIKGLTFETVMAGVHRLIASNPDAQFVPYPATWLNDGQWADVIPITQLRTTGPPLKKGAATLFAEATASPGIYPDANPDPSDLYPAEPLRPESRRSGGPVLEQDRNGSWFDARDDYRQAGAFGR